MRAADVEILIIPGFQGSAPEHWQHRWADKIGTARFVDLPAIDAPQREAWVAAVVSATERARRPVVLVPHSLGVHAVVHAAPRLDPAKVRGAFLVAPPSETAILSIDAIDMAFAPAPRGPLPFPSVLVASTNDPLCPILEAEEWAYAWGSSFSNAGDSGHLNTESGHGPWPEGLMRFAGFLSQLSA
jgi:uncharacterized protein